MKNAVSGCTPRRLIVGGLFLLLATMARFPDVFYHYRNWDEAALASQAWAMTGGDVLYRDIFQIHPPLNVVYYLPFFWLFEPHVVPHAVKAANIALVALCAALLFDIGRRWLRDRAIALVSATAFVFATSDRFPWAESSHGEFLSILPLTASVWLFLLGSPTRPTHAAIGALWATAFWIKQVALLDILFLACAIAMVGRSGTAALRTRFAWILAGFSAVGAVILFWISATGALSEALHSLFIRTTVNYIGGEGTRWSWGPWRTLWFELPGLCAAAMAATILSLRPGSARARSTFFFSAAWAMTVLLALSSAGRFYPQYLLQLTAPLAVAAAASLALIPARFRMAAAILASAAMALAMGTHTWRSSKALAALDWRPQAVREANEVASIVKANTRPHDRIFLYRVEHLDIFYLAGRASSNGIYMYHDMLVEHMHDPELTRAKQAQLLQMPPRAIVASRTLVDRFESAERFFWPLIERCYQRHSAVGEIEIFLLAHDPGKRDPTCEAQAPASSAGASGLAAAAPNRSTGR